MQVSTAVKTRRSVRAFREDEPHKGVVADILRTAGHAPSGGNLQPWHVILLEGDGLARFRKSMQSAQPDPPEYPVYPEKLHEPYRSRRFAVGEEMYSRLGIPREDKSARRAWFARNADFFGAPAAAFIFVDRAMGAAQWSDLGMYLQTAMLLATEKGLQSCAQEYWSMHHKTVTDFCDTPPELMLFCGLAFGYAAEDHPVNTVEADRAPTDEWLRCIDS